MATSTSLTSSKWRLHYLLDGPLHLLQDTLSAAGAATRFYPNTGNSPTTFQGSAIRSKKNQQKQKVTSKIVSRPSLQQDHKPSMSPATSSFTSPDKNFSGSTLSSRLASVKETTHPNGSQTNRLLDSDRCVAASKRGNNKKIHHPKSVDSVGKLKVSIRGTAHIIWSHIIGNDTNTKKGRRREKERVPSGYAIKNTLQKEDSTGFEKFNPKQSQGEPIFHESYVQVKKASLLKSGAPTFKSTATTAPTSIFEDWLNSSSIPLYPLIILLFLYHIMLKHIFSYRNRTQVRRKLQRMMGSKRFYVSQDELTRHINLISERNKSKGGGSNIATWSNGNGDAAGGCSHITANKGRNSSDSPSDKSDKGGFNSNLMMAISESLNLLKDEKDELLQQRRSLLHDRDCNCNAKELAASEKKLIFEILTEKVEELMEAKCTNANEKAQNLTDKLAQVENDRNKLMESTEKNKRLYAEALVLVNELKGSLKESNAKVEKLTNENIILTNVIDRLEEQNNEMEKVIDEACHSDNEDLDIHEIDIALVSSYSVVSADESLTKDEIDYQELERREAEVAKIEVENELLVKEVDQLRQSLSSVQKLLTQKEIENEDFSMKLSKFQTESNNLQGQQQSSLQNAIKQSRLESKVEELQKLLNRTQLDLENKSREKQDLLSSLSQLHNEKKSIQEDNIHSSLRTTDRTPNAAVVTLQVKNEQLQKSLNELEVLHRNLCVEKSKIEQSIVITSTQFKGLLSEKESLQSDLCKERKRITWCNKVLQDASNSASSLITELQAEMHRATGVPPSDKVLSPRSNSDGSPCSKTLMHHAEILQQQITHIKQTNEELVAVFQMHIKDTNEIDDVEKSRDTMLNKPYVNQTIDIAQSNSISQRDEVLDCTEITHDDMNGKIDSERRRRRQSDSPGIYRAISMPRLWRKKSKS